MLSKALLIALIGLGIQSVLAAPAPEPQITTIQLRDSKRTNVPQHVPSLDRAVLRRQASRKRPALPSSFRLSRFHRVLLLI